MALPPGTRLGPYEIQTAIGAGGMGEMYRATETNLGRHVAITVLPDAFAHDPERLARFEHEAKTLASLNHPNIAAIYGLEKTDRIRALVMELVEGPTLADRIAQGPIPVEEALPIAKQIAEAIEAAHEQGIIHRDLNSANIKVRPDGTVKVLDFGLAKAPADKRSDIRAFGCVLYELLTGQQPFKDETPTDALAALLKKERDWGPLAAGTPSRIRSLLRRCLSKGTRRRIHDIADARIELGEVIAAAPEVIEKDFASGKHSRASLVRGPGDVLLVWKRPNDDSKSHQMAFRKEVEHATTWRELGLSNIEVRWHDDNRSLLRTYVPGVLAWDRIQCRSFWTGDTYAKERLALAQLIVHAARQRAYVTDLNPRNLVFDGTRWQVIDSGSIRFHESPERTLREYREKLMARWSLSMHPSEHEYLREFLHGLTLQPRH